MIEANGYESPVNDPYLRERNVSTDVRSTAWFIIDALAVGIYDPTLAPEVTARLRRSCSGCSAGDMGIHSDIRQCVADCEAEIQHNLRQIRSFDYAHGALSRQRLVFKSPGAPPRCQQ